MMGKSLRILLVEDDEFYQLLISRIITEFGFSLEIVENGIDAIQKLQIALFDLIIMDVEMPEMDGYETTTSIRNQMADKPIPILIITVRNDMAEATKSLLLGANSFLQKPFTSQQLLKEIETLVL